MGFAREFTCVTMKVDITPKSLSKISSGYSAYQALVEHITVVCNNSPYVSEYSLANDSIVKHHPMRGLAKRTLPNSGATLSLLFEPLGDAISKIVLISSSVCFILKYASFIVVIGEERNRTNPIIHTVGGSLSSRINRSILFKTTQMANFS